MQNVEGQEPGGEETCDLVVQARKRRLQNKASRQSALALGEQHPELRRDARAQAVAPDENSGFRMGPL